MKKFFALFLVILIFAAGCIGGGGSSGGSGAVSGLYMLWTDALHDLDGARVQRTAQALRNAGYQGFVVTYDVIRPRPHTAPSKYRVEIY